MTEFRYGETKDRTAQKNPENMLCGKIFFGLINRERNKELLEDVPHRIMFSDMAVVYYTFSPALIRGLKQKIITNEMMDKWKVTENELYRVAEQNTSEHLTASLSKMDEIMEEMLSMEGMEEECGELLETESEEPSIELFVLTNNLRAFGAASLLYPRMLQKVAEIIKHDFFILPSSIHETILMPYSGKENAEELCELVRSVNETFIEKEDVLSDNVYLYRKDADQMLLVDGLDKKAVGV